MRIRPAVILVSSISVLSGLSHPATAQNPSEWGWGPQLGFMANTVGADLVRPGDVSIAEDGTVLLTRIRNNEPLLLLGAHRTLWQITSTLGLGVGLVVAPGEALIEAAGGGIVFEFKGVDDAVGFTLGIGAINRFSTFRLAEGWSVGQPAPPRSLDHALLETDETALAFWSGASF